MIGFLYLFDNCGEITVSVAGEMLQHASLITHDVNALLSFVRISKFLKYYQNISRIFFWTWRSWSMHTSMLKSKGLLHVQRQDWSAFWKVIFRLQPNALKKCLSDFWGTFSRKTDADNWSKRKIIGSACLEMVQKLSASEAWHYNCVHQYSLYQWVGIWTWNYDDWRGTHWLSDVCDLWFCILISVDSLFNEVHEICILCLVT